MSDSQVKLLERDAGQSGSGQAGAGPQGAGPPGSGQYWQDPEWQRIWLATQETEWRSLAILPAEPTLSTWAVAQALLQVGWRHKATPMVVADFRSVAIGLVDPLMREVQRHVAQGEIVLVALPCADVNPAAVHIARAMDRTMLCVRLGSSSRRVAQATVKAVGQERFLGMVTLRPSLTREEAPVDRKLLPPRSR